MGHRMDPTMKVNQLGSGFGGFRLKLRKSETKFQERFRQTSFFFLSATFFRREINLAGSPPACCLVKIDGAYVHWHGQVKPYGDAKQSGFPF